MVPRAPIILVSGSWLLGGSARIVTRKKIERQIENMYYSL